jgi:hypothetical protein
MFDIIIALFLLLCAAPTTVSAVIGREERGSGKRGPLRDRMLSQLGPASLQDDTSGRNSAFRCVSGPCLCLRCPETLFLLVIFAREAGGSCGKGIGNRDDGLL